MPIRHLLYQKRIQVTPYIAVEVPTVGEILEREDDYYSMVSMLTAMPIDMMVQLDDIGVDFASINEYELFLMLFNTLKEMNTELIFGGLDLKGFEPAINPDNNQIMLADKRSGARIDRAVHGKIAGTLRMLHGLEKDNRRPGNDSAKSYMIERARAKMKRARGRTSGSQLEELIVALVNTAEFPYDYEETRELSIYQFNQSLRQIIHKIDYDHRMQGVFAGTIDAKGLSQEDLTWVRRLA